MESKMKKLATGLIAAGALVVLSGCVDPYYGDAYYGGGFSGSPYGGSGYGYYRYNQPYNNNYNGGYNNYNGGYRNYYGAPYRDRNYDRRYRRY